MALPEIIVVRCTALSENPRGRGRAGIWWPAFPEEAIHSITRAQYEEIERDKKIKVLEALADNMHVVNGNG